MDFVAFGDKVMGYSHTKNESSCQDRFKIRRMDNALIIAVADGHGSDKCKYSGDGAQFAVAVYCDTFVGLCNQYKDNYNDLRQFLSRSKADILPKKLLQKWRDKVEEHHKKKRDGEKFELSLYGTTLMGVVITDNFYFAMQLGDGDILSIANDGTTTHVIQAEKILGTETYSLSSNEAWKDMLVEIHYVTDKDEYPVLFMLSTDGFANSFISEDEFMKNGADYLALLKENGEEPIKENLKNWLGETTKSGCGDDITLVLAYDKIRI